MLSSLGSSSEAEFEEIEDQVDLDEAENQAEDPSSEADLLEDAGYQLLYDEYHADAVEIVIELIESLYFGEVNGKI